MSTEQRCPNCGGLVGVDAEWCGQCFARLDRGTTPDASADAERAARRAPATSQPPGVALPGPPGARLDLPKGPAGEGPIRRTEAGIFWSCPRCDLDNPIEVRVCSRCGARFESLFIPPEERPQLDPGRAARLSLLFPGAGHISIGRTIEGVARAVVFAWIALTILAILVMRGGFRPGPLLPVLLMYLAAGAALYGMTAVDARRAAEGEPPLLSSRILMYGVGALILLTVGIMFVLGIRAG